MRVRSTSFIGALLMAGLVFGGASAPVLAQGHFALSGGVYDPEDDELDNTEVFGLRGGYRFHPNFGFEGSLSRVDLVDGLPADDGPSIPELDADLQVDLYNLDLSLQWFPRGGRLVVFGGPGIAQLDSEISLTVFGQTFSESDTSEIFTAHVGLGYEWRISDRFFIRPEARARRYFDDEPKLSDDNAVDFDVAYEATDYEAAVTFGWRIGA
jgi:hypothetical protein